jgi:large subunit ribosomal protein L10
LRPKRVEYHVVKNSLFTRAAAKTEREGLAALLTGPTAVALGDIDEVELAKSIVDEARALKALRILGAFIGGQTMSVDDLQTLAKLPSRAHLQGQIVGSLQAPLAQLTGLFQAPAQNLIHVLTARAQ